MSYLKFLGLGFLVSAIYFSTAQASVNLIRRAGGELYRPAIHYSPAANFSNDPNGLLYVNGVWHMYYQHIGNQFGKSWGYASSTDLFHWTEQPNLAIVATEDEQIFSGSAVLDTQNSAGFGENAIVAAYASFYQGDSPFNGLQATSIAYSPDGGETFTKFSGNPVINRNSANFRDPKVQWYAPGNFWLLVAVEATDRQVLFYRSTDLKSWTFLSTFGPGGFGDGVWECPDLFPLPVDGNTQEIKWVVLVSTVAKTEFFVGSFDGTTFVAEDGNVGWLDAGQDDYASNTWNLAPDSRRVSVGWVGFNTNAPTSPWVGSMTLPRELSLQTFLNRSTLFTIPVGEVSTLAQIHNTMQLSNVALQDGTNVAIDSSATGQVLDVDVTFDMGNAVQAGIAVRASSDESEETAIYWDRSTASVCVDRSHSGDVSFQPGFGGVYCQSIPLVNNQVRLQVFVDRALVEVFTQSGLMAMTFQIFPDPSSVGVHYWATGGNATMLSMSVTPLTPSMYT